MTGPRLSRRFSGCCGTQDQLPLPAVSRKARAVLVHLGVAHRQLNEVQRLAKYRRAPAARSIRPPQVCLRVAPVRAAVANMMRAHGMVLCAYRCPWFVCVYTSICNLVHNRARGFEKPPDNPKQKNCAHTNYFAERSLPDAVGLSSLIRIYLLILCSRWRTKELSDCATARSMLVFR